MPEVGIWSQDLASNIRRFVSRSLALSLNPTSISRRVIQGLNISGNPLGQLPYASAKMHAEFLSSMISTSIKAQPVYKLWLFRKQTSSDQIPAAPRVWISFYDFRAALASLDLASTISANESRHYGELNRSHVSDFYSPLRPHPHRLDRLALCCSECWLMVHEHSS